MKHFPHQTISEVISCNFVLGKLIKLQAYEIDDATGMSTGIHNFSVSGRDVILIFFGFHCII